MLALKMSTELTGDRDMFDRHASRHRDLRPFHRAVGVHAMHAGLFRLTQVLKQEDAGVRSGLLAGSLTVSPQGSGGNHATIFDVDGRGVETGSNLIYAAQVQFGGTILPVKAKMLAIPLTATLQRDGIGPRELDTKGVLRFQPTAKKPNVGGVLIDDEGVLGHGKGPLYALAYWITQEPRPYLFWNEDDERVIADDLWPTFLGLNAA